MSVLPHQFSLYKRPNGVYYVIYYDNGRQRWVSTKATTKPEALHSLTRLRELLQERSRSVLYTEFVKEFLAFAEVNYARKTVTLYKAILLNFGNLVRRASLREITAHTIDKYKTARLKALKVRGKQEEQQKVCPTSVNVELRMLRAAFGVAQRWRLVETNPFAGVQLASVPEKEPAYFSKASIQQLLDLVREQWLKELIVFSVATGMRQAETLNLMWRDVDLSHRVIHIHSTPTFKTKQGKRRTIPMSDVVHVMLSAKAGRSESDYVFTRSRQKIGQSFLTHRFKKYVRLAGLEEGLHWHSLRHTHASWLVQDGVSLYEVQRLLGHSSSKVTEVYSHLQPEGRHDTVNRIDLQFN